MSLGMNFFATWTDTASVSKCIFIIKTAVYVKWRRSGQHFATELSVNGLQVSLARHWWSNPNYFRTGIAFEIREGIHSKRGHRSRLRSSGAFMAKHEHKSAQK